MNRTRFIQQKHTQLKIFVRHAKTETNDGVILEPNEKTKDKHGFHIQQNIDKNIDGCFLFLKKKQCKQINCAILKQTKEKRKNDCRI